MLRATLMSTLPLFGDDAPPTSPRDARAERQRQEDEREARARQSNDAGRGIHRELDVYLAAVRTEREAPALAAKRGRAAARAQCSLPSIDEPLFRPVSSAS